MFRKSPSNFSLLPSYTTVYMWQIKERYLWSFQLNNQDACAHTRIWTASCWAHCQERIKMHGSHDDLDQDGALWMNLYQVLKKHATGYWLPTLNPTRTLSPSWSLSPTSWLASRWANQTKHSSKPGRVQIVGAWTLLEIFYAGAGGCYGRVRRIHYYINTL